MTLRISGVGCFNYGIPELAVALFCASLDAERDVPQPTSYSAPTNFAATSLSLSLSIRAMLTTMAGVAVMGVIGSLYVQQAPQVRAQNAGFGRFGDIQIVHMRNRFFDLFLPVVREVKAKDRRFVSRLPEQVADLVVA